MIELDALVPCTLYGLSKLFPSSWHETYFVLYYYRCQAGRLGSVGFVGGVRIVAVGFGDRVTPE